MRNRIMVVGIVFGLLVAGNVQASSMMMPVQQYATSQLELNPVLLNQNTVKTTAKTPAQTKNVNYTQTKTYTQKALSEQKKDLQIDGRIEKTQQDKLYTNQSDAEMQRMVNTIGRKLTNANNLTTSVNFKYNPNETINAYANGSNTVTVYKGLIKFCENEDELAYVVGHELGHVNSYHILKGAAIQKASSIAAAFAKTAVASATGNQWAAMGTDIATSTLSKAGNKKVSRVQEVNADLLSVDYIVKAGYNPLAAISIINKIGDNYPDFFSDHPSTDKRIQRMYNYIKTKYPKYLSAGYYTESYNQAISDYITREY